MGIGEKNTSESGLSVIDFCIFFSFFVNNFFFYCVSQLSQFPLTFFFLIVALYSTLHFYFVLVFFLLLPLLDSFLHPLMISFPPFFATSLLLLLLSPISLSFFLPLSLSLSLSHFLCLSLSLPFSLSLIFCVSLSTTLSLSLSFSFSLQIYINVDPLSLAGQRAASLIPLIRSKLHLHVTLILTPMLSTSIFPLQNFFRSVFFPLDVEKYVLTV